MRINKSSSLNISNTIFVLLLLVGQVINLAIAAEEKEDGNLIPSTERPPAADQFPPGVTPLTSMPDMDPSHPYLQEEEEAGNPPIPANLFSNGFERGNFDGWSSLEGARKDSITLVEDPTLKGEYAARFTVIKGDLAHHGARSEITRNLNDPPGSQGWYAWSIFIPKDYPVVADPTEDWQITCQFHDQPDLSTGQTWDIFPPHNSSIALHLLNQEQLAFALGFGVNLPKGPWQYGPVNSTRGVWNDVLFHIGWSTGDDGYAEAWVNGQPLTPEGGVKGRTLYYAYTDYLKLGMYRNPDITWESVVYVDEVRLGPTKESVVLPKERRKRCLRRWQG